MLKNIAACLIMAFSLTCCGKQINIKAGNKKIVFVNLNGVLVDCENRNEHNATIYTNIKNNLYDKMQKAGFIVVDEMVNAEIVIDIHDRTQSYTKDKYEPVFTEDNMGGGFTLYDLLVSTTANVFFSATKNSAKFISNNAQSNDYIYTSATAYIYTPPKASVDASGEIYKMFRSVNCTSEKNDLVEYYDNFFDGMMKKIKNN